MNTSPNSLSPNALHKDRQYWDRVQRDHPDEIVFDGINFAEGNLNLFEVRFIRKVRMIGCTFNGNSVINGVTFDHGLHFKDCRFNGKVEFLRLTSGGETMTLEGCEFHGPVGLSLRNFSALQLDSNFFAGLSIHVSGDSKCSLKSTSSTRRIFKDATSLRGDFQELSLPNSEFNDLNLEEISVSAVTSFASSTIFGDISARRCQFQGFVSFDKTVVAGEIRMGGCEFEGMISIRGGAQLNGLVDVSARTPSDMGGLLLDGAEIVGVLDVSNRRFTMRTSFTGAEFKVPPAFHGVTLFPDTSFLDAKFPDDFTSLERTGANSAENAYRSLRTACLRIEAHADEQRFFSYEMRARKATESNKAIKHLYGLYEYFSDYGQSIFKPLRSLGQLWLVSLMIYASIHALALSLAPSNCYCELVFSEKRFADLIALATQQTFPFVAGIKDFASTDILREIRTVSGFSILYSIWSFLSSALAITFLFLLGLGLRNKFRLR